ncbi:MAG TPA: hypothetical protein VMF30_05695, partial [Pirellulales bacterium]|nr:hypothetical protein [Pirellulales bacterium]
GMEASWDKFAVIQPGEGHPLLPKPVKDAVLLSADRRYEELVRRAAAAHGQIDAAAAMRLMDLPVALRSNLHDVLFAPQSTDLWVANASHDKQPAATQPYAHFKLTDLLAGRPDPAAPELPLPPADPAAQAALPGISD